VSPDRIFILTGAGVSAPSGVSTFRDEGGVWSRYDFREVATPEGFAANPGLVHEFYNARRAALPGVAPNAAHEALAALERVWSETGGRVDLVTQNVDDLHERAGSEKVLHMHGDLAKSRCEGCCGVAEGYSALSTETVCPACGTLGRVRPHVVWFGETPFGMDEIAAALAEADLFVAIGTSGSVYPAAGFVAEARAAGAPCVELNLEPSDNAYLFTDRRYGPADIVTPQFVAELVASRKTEGKMTP